EPQGQQNVEAATKLIAVTLAQAQREQVLGAQTELLNAAGQIATRKGDSPAAENAFHQAVEVARTAALPREEGEACLHLSQFYRATNQPTKASSAIDEGIKAVQQVEEAYDLP